MAITAQNTDLSPQTDRLPLKVELRPVINLEDEQLYEFCQINRDLRIERNAEGELLIMPPAGGETGERMPRSQCNCGSGRNVMARE